jgi:RHS repeat-associated protein
MTSGSSSARPPTPAPTPTAGGYGHDADGNITSINGSQTYTYNQANELTGGSPALPATPNYDGAANQTVQANGTTMAYNTLNQLTKITISGTATNLAYTGNTNNDLLNDANTTLVNSSPLGVISTITSGTQTNYGRDPDGTLISVSQGSNTYYPLIDTQGSVVALTGSSGTIISGATYRYDPYGNLISTAPTGIGAANPFRYKGGYTDPATNLIHYGARWYNPATSTFTQTDPTGQNPGYIYAGDNPINQTDSSGLGGITTTLCSPSGASVTAQGLVTPGGCGSGQSVIGEAETAIAQTAVGIYNDLNPGCLATGAIAGGVTGGASAVFGIAAAPAVGLATALGTYAACVYG